MGGLYIFNILLRQGLEDGGLPSVVQPQYEDPRLLGALSQTSEVVKKTLLQSPNDKCNLPCQQLNFMNLE